MRVAVIGAGTMGQALIRGLLGRGLTPRRLRATDASSAMRRVVARRFGIRVDADNRGAVRGADVVILAVKPQQMGDVVAELAPELSRRHLVVSIAAGITRRWLEARLRGVSVVRVMPNLPATVGAGFSAMTAGRRAGRRHRALVQALFSAVGEVVELPERRFDAVTAVSGSGPAYLFVLVEAWERAADALGLSQAVGRRAIRATLEGGLRLLETSGQEPSGLIAQVASKGGTTEAALRVLEQRRVAAAVIEAVRAAARRSRELSWS